MPKSDNQKLKIFYILDYLQKNSHQDKPVGAQELISMLDRQHNISCDRKTVYSDVKALQGKTPTRSVKLSADTILSHFLKI